MLQAYEKRSPEIVFEWNDAETDARGWVVINSLAAELRVEERVCIPAWTRTKLSVSPRPWRSNLP